MPVSRILRTTGLALALTGVAALAAPGVASAALPASPRTADTVLTPDTHKVTCGTRTDWFRLWTKYHGFPICYADRGYIDISYGANPPEDTWTSYGYCSGNNAGSIYYWFWYDHQWNIAHDDFGKGTCDDFTSTFGETVEVFQINIT